MLYIKQRESDVSLANMLTLSTKLISKAYSIALKLSQNLKSLTRSKTHRNLAL